MKKPPKKNGSPKKRSTPRPRTMPRDPRVEVDVQATIDRWVREQGDARQSVRMLLRCIAWLMQHRDAWDAYSANIPFDALRLDVDVGMHVDTEKRAIIIAPAPVAPETTEPETTEPAAAPAEEGTP